MWKSIETVLIIFLYLIQETVTAALRQFCLQKRMKKGKHKIALVEINNLIRRLEENYLSFNGL